MTGFGTRLLTALNDRLPLCVGIDPHAGLLDDWGLPQSADGLKAFCETCVESFAGEVAAVKPQSAFFERFGSAGIAVLEQTIDAARSAGALVVLDAKRGDIGSTAQAYADAYLDPRSTLFADALTVSPYLGFGSLDPLVERALAVGSGLFVLARTSNPEGAEVQAAIGDDGRTVGQQIVDDASAVNAGSIGDGDPLGSIGVVVGATVTPGELDLSLLGGPVLAPGVGEQGAGGTELRALFGGLKGLLPSSSRDILRTGPDRKVLLDTVRRTATEVSADQA